MAKGTFSIEIATAVGDQEYMVVEAQRAPEAANHPLLNEKNHEQFISYLKPKIDFAINLQDPLRERYESIDKELAGFLALDADDRKRQANNLVGKAPTPVKFNPSFALTQLGRGVTYLLSVFAPDNSLYEALAKKDDLAMANAFVALMNQHSIRGRYFREQCKFFLDLLKYNLGGMSCWWADEWGMKFGGDAAKAVSFEQAILWSGNKIKSCDMYNTFWEPGVHPVDVCEKAEYAGEVKVYTHFQLARMIQNGEIFNVEGLNELTAQSATKWYRSVASVRFNASPGTMPDGLYDWTNILSAGRTTAGNKGYEIAHVYCWVIPAELNLVPGAQKKERKKLELFRFSILNGQRLVRATKIDNAHQYIPYVFGNPNEDGLGLQSKSPGEHLLPLQQLGAFAMNTYVEAMRKNIWEMIVYDPMMIDLAAAGTDVAGRVPTTGMARGKDINTFLKKFDSTLDTEHHLDVITKILELIEWFFPTRQLSQVADIERATTNQVAATVQASQRDAWKTAKLVDDQAMSKLRFMQAYNIMQYQDTIEISLPDGSKIKINPQELRDKGIEYALGEGLRTLDKMSVQQFVKDLIGLIVQSQSANEFDIVGLIDFLSKTFGVETDLTQFRRVQPPAPLPGKDVTPQEAGRDVAVEAAAGEQQRAAAQAGQQAAIPAPGA